MSCQMGSLVCSSSIRHTQDEQLKCARQSAKSVWEVQQGKSLDKTNSLLENLCATMKTLVDVEQRKSTLVAQTAKAASLAGATSVAPASSPASSPAGSARLDQHLLWLQEECLEVWESLRPRLERTVTAST